MFLVSPRVRELLVLLKDSVLSICKRKPTEVTEELDVSDHGIQPELDSLLLEQVNLVTTTEPNLTKKSTESEREMINKMPLPDMI